MIKKELVYEFAGALAMALLLALVFPVLSISGGFLPEDLIFLGNRGYEARGLVGQMVGLLVGGILGALLVWRKCANKTQNVQSAVGLGVIVALLLNSALLITIINNNYEASRSNEALRVVEANVFEYKLDCAAGCEYLYDHDGNEYYVAYVVLPREGAPPTTKASCYRVDANSNVIQVGVSPVGNYEHLIDTLDPKRCTIDGVEP